MDLSSEVYKSSTSLLDLKIVVLEAVHCRINESADVIDRERAMKEQPVVNLALKSTKR